MCSTASAACSSTEKRTQKAKKRVSKEVRKQEDRWTRAGLPIEILREYPEFGRAVLKSHLHHYLREFSHKIGRDLETGEPTLLVDGRRRSWTELKRRFDFTPAGIHDRSDGSQWTYMCNGLERHSATQWSKLRPFDVLPQGKRPSQPILQIVSRDAGMHAWIRLVSTSGEVTSVGMLASNRPRASRATKSSLSEIYCPDVFEFDPGKKTVVDIPIDQRTLEAITTRIEAYKRIGVHFNLADHNCNVFAAAIAGMAGEKIDLDRTLGQMFIPRPIQRAYQRALPQKIRRAIQRFLDFIGMFGPNEIANTVALGLGAAKGVGDQNLGAIIETPADFITSSKVVIQWPGGLREWQKNKLREASDAKHLPTAAHHS